MDDQPLGRPTAILASLIGEWRGRGVVKLPSMPSRRYVEAVRFSHRSAGSLDYWQRATDPEDGTLLHSESGIWRLVGARIELSVALPGATEVSEGPVTDHEIALASTTVGRASTGAPLVRTARRYELSADSIVYEIRIATVTTPTFAHLSGALHRVERLDSDR